MDNLVMPKDGEEEEKRKSKEQTASKKSRPTPRGLLRAAGRWTRRQL